MSWRKLAEQGKYIEAAELLIQSTNNPGSKARTNTRETDYFHAGQCYAFAGPNYYKMAISHFVKAHKPGNPEWNRYITATICFLREDVPALEKAVEQMKTLIPEDSKDKPLIPIADSLLEHAKAKDFSYISAYPTA